MMPSPAPTLPRPVSQADRTTRSAFNRASNLPASTGHLAAPFRRLRKHHLRVHRRGVVEDTCVARCSTLKLPASAFKRSSRASRRCRPCSAPRRTFGPRPSLLFLHPAAGQAAHLCAQLDTLDHLLPERGIAHRQQGRRGASRQLSFSSAATSLAHSKRRFVRECVVFNQYRPLESCKA